MLYVKGLVNVLEHSKMSTNGSSLSFATSKPSSNMTSSVKALRTLSRQGSTIIFYMCLFTRQQLFEIIFLTLVAYSF